MTPALDTPADAAELRRQIGLHVAFLDALDAVRRLPEGAGRAAVLAALLTLEPR
jgi:hypothetical protein